MRRIDEKNRVQFSKKKKKKKKKGTKTNPFWDCNFFSKRKKLKKLKEKYKLKYLIS